MQIWLYGNRKKYEISDAPTLLLAAPPEKEKIVLKLKDILDKYKNADGQHLIRCNRRPSKQLEYNKWTSFSITTESLEDIEELNACFKNLQDVYTIPKNIFYDQNTLEVKNK